MEEDTIETLTKAKRAVSTLKAQSTLLIQQREQLAKMITRNDDYLQEANQHYVNVLRRLHHAGVVDKDGQAVATVVTEEPENNSPEALTG